MAEEKVTLPCHHQLGLPEKDTLDIEWLLTDNEGNQKVVSTLLARAALLSALAFAFFKPFPSNDSLNDFTCKATEKDRVAHTYNQSTQTQARTTPA